MNKNWMMMLVLCTIFFWGCKDEHTPVKEVTIPDPECEAYASPSVILYNGSTTLFWDSKNVTSVTINDIPVSSTTGSKSLKALTKDTLFTVKFIGENKQVVFKFVKITVGLPVVTGDAWVSLPRIYNGGSTTLIWESSKDVTSVIINGILAPTTTGSIEVKALKKDTAFVLTFIGINGLLISKVVNVTVIIYNPDQARTDSLCLNKYWKLVSIKYLKDGIWYTINLDEEQLSSKGFYYPDGNGRSFDADGKLDSSGKWAWYSSNSIIWDNITITPYKLTNDSLILYDINGTIVTTYKWYPL